jgi:lysophospholipase L1-like esterase
MNLKISRRDFLGLSLVGILSACTPKSLGKPTSIPTATFPGPTATFDTSPHTYSADDPGILYSGRVDFSDAKKPVFSAPGVVVKANFHGTGAAVLLQDEFKYGTSRNYYDAVIDGTTVVKIAPEQAVTRYEVAVDLPEADHTLALVKRTEASIGKCTFLGFEFAGLIGPAPFRPVRRLEFIGDSITCGTGDEAMINSSQCTEDGWGQPYNNARLSYGPMLSRSLDAEYHLSAVSGIGMVRNYSFQYDDRPMPEVYDSLFFEQVDSPRWDPQKYIPDALVIALGSNDFSPGDSDRPIMQVDEWVEVALAFVGKLRQDFPTAHIFMVSSPILGDNWPTGEYKSATDQKVAITRVVEQLNGTGDDKVHKFFSSPIVGMGCTSHPDVNQHTVMAEQLGRLVASVMGWQ